MKKIVFCLLVLLPFHGIKTAAHADNYRDSLQVLMVLTQTQKVASWRTMMATSVLEQKFGKSLTYVMNQFTSSKEHLKMLTDIYEPACREHLSEDEMASLLHWLRTSKITTFDPKSYKSLSQNEAARSFVQTNIERLKKVPKKAAKGKTMTVSPSSQVKKSYRALAFECIDKMEEMDTTISIMVPVILNSLNLLTPEQRTLPEVRVFMREFFREWFVLSFNEIYKEDDLRYFIQGVDSDPYRHYSEALEQTMSMGNLMNVEVMAAFSSYVSIYHPHLVGMLEQILENPQRK